MAKKKPKGRSKNKPRGHYCRICGEHKANEKFSGRGHATHICKACHSLPLTSRNELEHINKIERISNNFFISKENLNRLKKYMRDTRYPEASEYAGDILESYYNRIGDYSDNKNGNEFREPVLYSELDDALKTETRSRMEELISEYLEFAEYMPDKEDMDEILNRLCEEITDTINGEIADSIEFTTDKDCYVLFDADSNENEDWNEDELEKNIEEDIEIQEKITEKELVIDKTLRSMFKEILNVFVQEIKDDGFELPYYSDTLIVAETERLKIRKFTMGDLNDLFLIMKKESVMYSWEHIFRKKDVKKWINTQFKRYKDDGYGYFAVTLKGTENEYGNGKLIGQVGIMKSEIKGEKANEIGYIFDDKFWRNGYATEATKACVELAFGGFNIEKLYCTIRPENESSIRVAERLNMRKTGEFTKLYNEKEMLHSIYELKKAGKFS